MSESEVLRSSSPPTLTFLVSVDDVDRGETGEKGIFGRSIDLAPSLRDIPVNVLQESLTQTLDALRKLFDVESNTDGRLPLKQIQVSFEVTASGKIALLGTGAEVAGKGAITLIFGS